MFVLLDGGADVEVGGKAVHHYSRGGYFGELSLIQNAPRTATVRASCDTTCLVLDKPTLETQGGGDFALLYVRHCIHSVKSLQGMVDAELDRMAEALTIEYFNAGYAIITQGETGDAMYFLVSGGACVRVDVREIVDGKMKYRQTVVHNYGQGDSFGERALLQNTPRAASVVATEMTVCFVLHRRDFKRMGVHERDARQFLASVPILQSLSEDELTTTVEALGIQYFVEGDKVIEQGEVGDVMYLIHQGSAEVIVDGEHVHQCVKGHFFGELALLSDAPRAATVTASSMLKCYTLSKRDFIRYMPYHMFDEYGDALKSAMLREVPVFAKLQSDALLSIVAAAKVWHCKAGKPHRRGRELWQLHVRAA